MRRPKIRIIGGEKIDIPRGVDIIQTPPTLAGLSHQVDLYEADIIIISDGNTYSRFPQSSMELENLGKGISHDVADALQKEGQAAVSACLKNGLGEEDVLSYKGLVTRKSDEDTWVLKQHACGVELCRLYRQALTQILDSCLVGVKAGGVLFLLIPADPGAARITKFLMPGLVINNGSDSKVFEPQHAPCITPGLLWDFFRTAHASLVENEWPFNLGVKAGRQARASGVYPTHDVIPMIPGDDCIRFYPGAVSTRGAAKSLLVEHGKGGIVIMPALISLDNLVEKSLQHSLAEKTAAPVIQERLCSKKEAADLLDVSTRTIDRMVKERKLKKIKLSARSTKFAYSQIMSLVSGK